MKLHRTKKGFTLIELLVVITIIGILATWAIATYTSQIQKARDTVRINDVKALQSGIEQVYQDDAEYPYATNFAQKVTVYVEKLPADSKHSQPCNDGWTVGNAQDCWYAYVTGPDNNGILYWEYEVSTAFENSWNITGKAEKDGWWIDWETTRLELGIDIVNNITAVAKDWITEWNWSCRVWWALATTETEITIINGNPTTLATSSCN